VLGGLGMFALRIAFGGAQVIETKVPTLVGFGLCISKSPTKVGTLTPDVDD